MKILLYYCQPCRQRHAVCPHPKPDELQLMLQAYIFKMHFNVLASKPRFSKLPFSFGFPHQNHVQLNYQGKLTFWQCFANSIVLWNVKA